MQLETKKLSQLIHATYNPRKDLQPMDEEYQKIKRSIEEFGYVEPIIVNSDNTIIGGHQRAKVLKNLGYDEVEVIVIDLDKTKEKALNVALNKISGEWDFEKLSVLLADIENEINIALTGFDMSDVEEMLANLTAEEEKEIKEDDFDTDAELDEIDDPITKMGDIWQLGRHRLMCGDSTDAKMIRMLTDGIKVDMVFTDPPYGMKKENDGVANDNLNFDDLLEFNRRWIPLTFDALKENGSWYCWGIDEPLMDIYSHILKPMARNNQITFRNLLTWNKGNGQGQLSELFRSYATADEKCLFVMCGVQGFNNNADNYFEGYEPIRKYLEREMEKCGGSKNWRKALGNGMGGHYFTKSQWVFPTEDAYTKLQNFGLEYSAFKREYNELKREWYSTRAYFNNTHDNMNNVWHFNRAGKEERVGHATPKPIALCGRAIKSSSRENEIVLDVFGGSGSTMIACEQLNRTCYMMEFEPKWVDVIIKRWEEFTGLKARKIS